MKAYLYEDKSGLPLSGKTLTIDNKGVAFFIKPVNESKNFRLLESNTASPIWRLHFFVGSPFEQRFLVRFESNGERSEHLVGRAIHFDSVHGSSDEDAPLTAASIFLRNSKALTMDNARKITSDSTLLIDRNGFAYFSSRTHQFQRIVLCQALAIAYKTVLSNCMNELTMLVRTGSGEDTLRLYEKILYFNAADSFSMPVLPERHELYAAWQMLFEHYKLDRLGQELTSQLSDVANLVRAKRERVQELRDKRRDWILGVVGVVVGIVGIVMPIVQLVF